MFLFLTFRIILLTKKNCQSWQSCIDTLKIGQCQARSMLLLYESRMKQKKIGKNLRGLIRHPFNTEDLEKTAVTIERFVEANKIAGMQRILCVVIFEVHVVQNICWNQKLRQSTIFWWLRCVSCMCGGTFSKVGGTSTRQKNYRIFLWLELATVTSQALKYDVITLKKWEV